MGGPIDLFLVAGQSNAQGRGSSAQSPAVTNGSLMWTGTGLAPLADPVGGAATGSAWPAFANAYGRCAIVGAAVGGSSLIDGISGGSWKPTGSLFGDAVIKAQSALAALTSAGWTPTLRGVLWHQGETEGLLYTGTATELRSVYAAALTGLLTRFRAELGPVDMWVARLGKSGTDDTALWQAVRDAQVDVCASVEGIHMAFLGCVDFLGPALMKPDGLHYLQPALNIMGTAMGEYITNPSTGGGLIGLDGQPIVQYHRVNGIPVAFTDETRP